ncbi:cytidine deaminase-like protein [Cristinia sonorae]|uniref:Cytidine deaminase-like protein n=1 Tax=Cristinia sonorae TaxID=1940300 RepID=A0A8K0XU84_9AGAR|nr:cytidine deaminase-like protein [Cristinia sonorae]
MSNAIDHVHFMRLALNEARKCTATPTAFCVGAVLTLRCANDPSTTVLATGYSRELPGNTHAEANALVKARALSPEALRTLIPTIPSDVDIGTILSEAEMYTTMEPCSVRTSGLAPCADALIAANIRKCYIGVGEPDDFVKCEGAQRLVNAGIAVEWIKGLEEECLKAARLGH